MIHCASCGTDFMGPGKPDRCLCTKIAYEAQKLAERNSVELMNLYSVEAEGPYCGGMAIVAANAPEDAVELASKIRNSTFKVDYSDPRYVKRLDAKVNGPERIVTHYEMGE